MVRFGLGAFFRANGALVIEDAMRAAGGDWGIIGVSLRSPRIRDNLADQGNVYTAVEMNPQSKRSPTVEALNNVIFAPENPKALLEQMADPAIRIVSLTVTEKGYCHSPSLGALGAIHPEIRKDIEAEHPATAIGFIVRALERRRAAGLRPFTVLSCDNLPDNGQVARNVVVGLVKYIGLDLAEWIDLDCRFPSTMVDRIVPATTPADVHQLAALAGFCDLAPVFHEPFFQWTIEDRFVDDGRPVFEACAGGGRWSMTLHHMNW